MNPLRKHYTKRDGNVILNIASQHEETFWIDYQEGKTFKDYVLSLLDPQFVNIYNANYVLERNPQLKPKDAKAILDQIFDHPDLGGVFDFDLFNPLAGPSVVIVERANPSGGLVTINGMSYIQDEHILTFTPSQKVRHILTGVSMFEQMLTNGWSLIESQAMLHQYQMGEHLSVSQMTKGFNCEYSSEPWENVSHNASRLGFLREMLRKNNTRSFNFARKLNTAVCLASEYVTAISMDDGLAENARALVGMTYGRTRRVSATNRALLRHTKHAQLHLTDKPFASYIEFSEGQVDGPRFTIGTTHI